MLDIFRGLKNLVKVSHIQIDSAVFRLHYSITVMMLIAFSLIVTTRQYVGNPIDCIHTKDIPEAKHRRPFVVSNGVVSGSFAVENNCQSKLITRNIVTSEIPRWHGHSPSVLPFF
ncbi:hypothetical protein RUM44_012776 [Polyplax serrata]|uniref:Innexin n=1 Tax=Polyplax serrata TaxID=468196 RepID=A0ABR1BCL2_POLSC